MVRVPGEILALSMDQLRDLVTRDSILGEGLANEVAPRGVSASFI
ncbi:hypothetical protein AB0K49_25755 [Streptomyces decoyicus]